VDSDAIEEMFAGLGPVTIKRMFGGKGIYHAGLIVAIDLKGDVMLKADAESAALFAQAGAMQWSYEGKPKTADGAAGKPVFMPYWSIPDSAFDDPDEMTRWTRLAYEAAVRSAR
jgi:DNA transformation protein